MPASPESYVIASGEPLGAGRFIAPSISGGIWTPDRDAAGNVLRGNWDGLPLNTWLTVDGQVLNDVIETPHYINAYGSDGSAHIIGAWSGGGVGLPQSALVYERRRAWRHALLRCRGVHA